MNYFYELLAKSIGMDSVIYGQQIDLPVDVALAHDGSMPKIIDLIEKKCIGSNLVYADKLHVTVDHYFPASTSEQRNNFLNIKQFSNKHGIHLYANGEGVLHQVIAEKFGTSLKDKIVVGVDGHVSTSAALGSIPFSITPDEMTTVLTNGKYSISIPSVVLIELNGENRTLSGKDIALKILGELGKKELDGKAVLISGTYLKYIDQDKRMTIANMLGEASVKTCYYLHENKLNQGKYHQKHVIIVDQIEKLIALPGSPENVRPVKEVVEKNITQVFIGGCTNGRLEDMRQVAMILKGNKVHDKVTLIICPASRKVANDMDRLGYSNIIRESGGTINNPGCGACSGIHQGVLGEKDVAITTTARNTAGRMGNVAAKIYLASPEIAAMAALSGEL